MLRPHKEAQRMKVHQPYPRRWGTAAGEKREAWVVEWWDENEKRHREHFRTKRKAFEKYDDLQRSAGARAASAGLVAGATVAQAGEHWLDQVESSGRADGKPPVEASTARKYREHFDKYIALRIGSRVIDTFTPKDARDYQKRIATDPDIPDGMRKKVFDDTKMLFGAAVGVYIPASPFDGLKMGKRRSKRAKAQAEMLRMLGEPSEDGKRAPTLEETRILLRKADDLAQAEADMGMERRFWLEWGTMLHLLVFVGGRISELLGLPWRYLLTDLRLAVIAQRADYRDGKIGAPKSAAGVRLVTLPQGVCDRLEKWRPHCPQGPLGLVFPNGAGNVESQSNIRERFLLPLFRATNLIATLPDGREVLPFTSHDYRGFHNELERNLGVTIVERMEKHGWSSADMADLVYKKQIMDPEIAALRQRSAEALARLVWGGPPPADVAAE
jgi:integrase